MEPVQQEENGEVTLVLNQSYHQDQDRRPRRLLQLIMEDEHAPVLLPVAFFGFSSTFSVLFHQNLRSVPVSIVCGMLMGFVASLIVAKCFFRRRDTSQSENTAPIVPNDRNYGFYRPQRLQPIQQDLPETGL